MSTIKGTNGAETKTGTASADLIYGYGGNDALYGRAGNDTIWGGVGDDKIWGEAGHDILRGEDGHDAVYGGDGTDTLYGGFGNDTLYGDGGTDTLYGDAGNDIIKGGTGISKLYGGEGNDSLYYDPTTSPIRSFESYFDTTKLDGGSGTDTLNIFNKSTYAVATSTGGSAQKPSLLVVYMDPWSSGSGGIRAMDPNAPYDGQISEMGKFGGIEKIVMTSAGGANFSASIYGPGVTAVGTAANDKFYSQYASDIFDGGLGNDEFHIGGGNDQIVSGASDSDVFYLDSQSQYGDGSSTIKGFNGAGVAGGDKIYLPKATMQWEGSSISELNGKTTFTLDPFYSYSPKDTFTFDAIGLKQDVDYFLV